MHFGSLAVASCILFTAAVAALAQSGATPADNSQLRTGRAAFR
jgi:hypothetical protein